MLVRFGLVTAYYNPPPGWMTLILVVFFLMGTQSFCLGLIGEYIGNIYREAKDRPLWIVDRAAGFSPDDIQMTGRPAETDRVRESAPMGAGFWEGRVR